MNKRNTLPIDQFAIERAITLSEDPEFESDQLLVPLLTLQRIITESQELYQREIKQGSASRLVALVEKFVIDLDLWRASIAPHLRDHGMLSTTTCRERVRC